MLSTIKGRLNLFLFLLTIMKETSKGVDGRTVETLKHHSWTVLDKMAPSGGDKILCLAKASAGTEAPRPRQVGTEQALHLNSWLIWHPVTLLEATANILEQLAWDPKQWGVPKKHARSGIQRCNPPGTGRVDNTAPDFSKGNHKPQH